MRYKVYEASSGNLTTVLETDSLEAAKARYALCYASQRGQGGVWDNVKKGWAC